MPSSGLLARRITLSPIEIIDRRGEKKSHAPLPKEIMTEEGAGEWESVGFILVQIPNQGGHPILSGRAVGVRKDGVGPFAVDFFLPPIWPEDLDWTKEARKRLNTFLNCSCRTGAGGACAVHKLQIPEWVKSDSQRLEMMGNTPLPRAIELMMQASKVAAEKQNLIVAPGRG